MGWVASLLVAGEGRAEATRVFALSVATVDPTPSSVGLGTRVEKASGASNVAGPPVQLRLATFSLSLNRNEAGELVSDLSLPPHPNTTQSNRIMQVRTVAEIIQRVRPDALLLNEFDYVPGYQAIDLFRDNFLAVGQNTLAQVSGGAPIAFPYRFAEPSNTGVPSGFDLDNNGSIGGGNDALGFGNFPGQYGMALLSKYPIIASQVRTFQNFLWRDMPGALLPDDPNTPQPQDWYSSDELNVFRLSSKSHWDVPIDIHGTTLHLLVSHPTPPTFDGPEDRNGKRNHDEIRFWADYISPERSGYIYDDQGRRGGLAAGDRFVIMGDQNADPMDGDSVASAIQQLLSHPLVNSSLVPSSVGGVEQATLQGGANARHRTPAAHDTADFADTAPGNLRVDYVLPSAQGLTALTGGVFWPSTNDVTFRLVGTFNNQNFFSGFPSSDHRLVWVDVQVPATPLEVILKVEAKQYAAFSTGLTNGAWVYVDADPAAGSPLRAMQRCLGYREVDYKAAVYPTLYFSPVEPVTNGGTITYDYSAQAAKTATVGFWANKDLPIIIGPDGNAYITDGHHTSASYLAPASPVREFIPGLQRVVLGHIVANYYDAMSGPQPVTDAWWLARIAENNGFLYGPEGNQLTLPGEPNYASLQPILPSLLPMPTTPSTLTTNGATAMLSSRLRGLMWGLADGILMSAFDNTGRKIAGFKKSAPGSSADLNFVEFYWADFMRNRIEWDDTKSGSPYGSTNGDANIISAPLSFFAAVANGVALARSEAYRDQYGRALTDYTNSALFSVNTVNWAAGSLSNGFAKSTDTYHLYLRDDSGVTGDIVPSALATNILHLDTDSQLVVTQALRNLASFVINGGGSVRTAWKDTTVSNSTLLFPAGTGIAVLEGTAYVSRDTVLSNGALQLDGTLNSASVSVSRGLLYGEGTVNGAVTVQSEGTLAAGIFFGAPRVNGALTLQGTVWADAFKSGSVLLGSFVSDITTLTYGGTLVLDVAGSALALGDAIKLFDAASYTGAFSSFDLPPLAAGLAWDTSSLIVDGTIRVGLATPPVIALASSPAAQIANVGTPVTLAGGAVGTLPITYQWRFKGTNVSGATNATLNIASVRETNQGLYVLIAENAAGSVTSAPALLTVNQTPMANGRSITFVWTLATNISLSASDADGDALTYSIAVPPAQGTLTGSGRTWTYRPNFGANGADSFQFKVNDGRVDSAQATVTLNIIGAANQGLVGVGRIPADAFDARGTGLDSLGGIGSGAFFDPASWSRSGDASNGYTYTGTLYAVPDRGFGDGTQNYLPRVQTLSLRITPHYGTNGEAQTQITLSNTATLLFTYGGTNYTGYDADDMTSTAFPRSTVGSLGQGHRSLDPEGIVRLADGSFFVSDEYGPGIYKFDSAGALEYMLPLPESIQPKLGGYPGAPYFSATNAPTSGRRNNRGLEGLSITPDGTRLFAMLQSPTMQDGGAGSSGRNTRVLIYDVDPASATFTQPLAEYVYVLTMNGSAQTNRNTPVSEILALNRQEFLVLERDSGQGFGTGTNLASTYKRVVLASIVGASNILNTPYDLEKGAPGQISLASGTLPPNVAPVRRFDLVDMLDPGQLARFGLNNSTNQDHNTLSEKWESLSLVPLNDPMAPNDFLLLVMNDNDFKAPVVHHNGVPVGTNEVPVDTMMLAFRVSLPTLNSPVPPNALPAVALVAPTNATLAAPADFALGANAYDQDGLITRVEFYQIAEEALYLGEDTTWPYTLPITGALPGAYSFFALAEDNDGDFDVSDIFTVIVTETNLRPSVTITAPAHNSAFFAPADITITAAADDVDGSVARVEFYQGTMKLGQDTTAPFSLRFTNSTVGTFSLTAVVFDNLGASNQAVISVIVNPAVFIGFVNKGLVGVGRIPAESFDLLGPGIDTLGGVFSAMHFDPNTWMRSGNASNGYTYSGTIYAMPDRGFGDGAQDFHPRRQTFTFSITPYYGTAPVPQNQIQLSNSATLLLTYNGTNFTGFDGSNILQTAYPTSLPGSLGQGRRSMDPEGMVMMPDGTFFVSDEYGPFLYHFNALGEMIGTIVPPEGILPKLGNYPGTNYYTGATSGVSGRRGNRGFEGLSITPDGKRLVTTIQSPLVQDGGSGNGARNNRIFEFDIDPLSPTYGRVVAEYVHQLTLNGNAATNRNTPLSELLAVNYNTYLLIERDNNGMGSGSSTPPLYKRIVLSSTAGATNIANTGYGLEKGAPYSTSLPTATLPSGISAMPRMDLIDLLDTNQLSKFGFVVTTNIEPSAIPEKFEGLTLVPLQDPAFPNDYLLLVGSDNDFFAPVVYHNGQPLVTNTLFMDTVVFAYRVTLPNVGRVAPENLLPGVVFTGPTNATFSAPADFTLATTAYDQDGIVTKVEFYEGETKLGEDTSFPFLLPLTGVPAAVHAYIAVATDHLGAVSTSALKTVTVTVENLLPAVALVGPTNASLSAPARVVLNATAGDADGTVTRLQVFDGSTLVGDTANSTLTLTLNGVLAGIHTYTAYAIDNQNATNASIPVVVNVTAENLLPAVEVTAPADGATYIAPANFTLTAAVGDADGFVTNVTFYRNGTRLGAATASPWNLAVSNQPLGALSFTAVAFDNQGSNTTSAAVAVTVLKNVNTQPLTLQILHASDLEAGVNAVFDAPAFSSVLGALKAQMPANTLILSSGDNYIPGPFFNAAGDAAAGFNGVAGRADIAMLNAMGFQAAAFGNHEFDAGPPQVRSLILRDTAVGYQGTMFPYLSANLDFSTDSSMASLVTTDGKLAHTASNQIAKSCVLSVVGQQIGIVGATTKELRSISSPGNVGVNTNIAAAVQSAVDALLAQGLNKIIVLAHLQQYANEIELAQQLRDVDVVIAGGSHAIFAKPTDHLRAGDVAATNYPVWLNTALGEPVAVVNAGANYEYVGRLILNFGTNGLIVAYDPASGVYATDEEGVFLTGNYPTNATVLNIASTIGGIINAKDGNLFGRTTVYLNGLRQYGRTEEINLGNLTADANLWRGQQVDSTASISLKNGGGIRDSIGAVLGYGGGAAYVPPLANPSVGKQFGDISQLDIENALRFNNGLALITLTAQQLRDTMEWGVAAVAPGATPGQFPQIGGMWFSYNPTNPAMTYTRSNTVVTGIATPGSRLQSLVARRGDGSLDLVVENGVLVGDPNRTFRMVTLGFLADGGDTYYPLTQASNRVNLAPTSGNTFTTDGGEQWALAAYLTNIHVYTQADTTADRDQRIQNMAFRTDTVTWPLLTRVVPGAGVTIYFTTLPGKHYEVWSAQTLGGSWINLTPTTPITGTGFLASYTDTTPGSPTFYRLRRID